MVKDELSHLTQEQLEQKEVVADDGTTFTEALAELVIQRIYKLKISSPYAQLLYIETYSEKWEVSYNQLSRAIRKVAKDYPKCISCEKKLAKPCHTVNMKDISYLRKRKNQTETGKGKTYENKLSPKMNQIEGILSKLQQFNLNDVQKKNIKDNLKDLRPELLTILAGHINHKKTVTKEPTPKVIATLGLVHILPPREQLVLLTDKPPKYGSKIDIKTYFTFWNYTARLRYLEPFLDDGENKISDARFNMEKQTFDLLPYPCEKDTDFWEPMFPSKGGKQKS